MNDLNEIRQDVKGTKKDIIDAYQVSLETIKQNYEREKFTVKCLMCIIVALICINAYAIYQLSTTTVIETWEAEQEGDYNLIDSDGNFMSSDLGLEDDEELTDNGETEGQENQTKS